MNRRYYVAGILIALFPVILRGQTSGPSSPDVQKFTPASSRQLVNLFTGDLNYNINLLELDGGYPLNISYSSGGNMMAEAGSTGFGWQLNIGRINRTVRGLPDDFNGEEIIKRSLYQQKDWNIGIGVGVDAEVFGLPIGVGATTGISFSNMRGVDIEHDLSAGITEKIGDVSLTAGLTLGMGTNEWASISPNAGLQTGDFGVKFNTKISSLEGMKYGAFTLTDQGSGIPITFPLQMARTPFTPRIDFPTSNVSGSLHFRIGGEIWGVSVGGEVYGRFAVQSNSVNVRGLKGYGYLYLQDKVDKDAIMDMASEKEGPVFQEDKNLYISYLANDLYSVSAQGLTGSFRPFRKDIGTIHNENQNSTDGGGSLGGEIHSGGYFHGGIDITANISNTYAGEWQNNPVSAALLFLQPDKRPPVYFKNVGETNAFANMDALTALGGFQPVRFDINESTVGRTLNGVGLDSAKVRKKAEPQNTSFAYLTAEEAEMAKKPFDSYSEFPAHIKSLGRWDRTGRSRNRNHISYITITGPNGMIYEFGIAAYNTVQKEVSFNVAERAGTNELYEKTTGYDPGVDNTPQNNKGRTNYFTTTETPPYAYAYLLTAVYSSDYVDVTGDGPTPDDFGTYTKFNYTLETTSFKWRTPYQRQTAGYNPGNLSDKSDDMGNYVYGEKEIWQIHSMETKNYIVEFHTSPRKDAYEVVDENGGINKQGQQLTKIDCIKVFTRIDYHSANPVPIKTVTFNYDESLCPNIPANGSDSGKLTLKKLYFSYNRSDKGKNSYYAFHYNNENDPGTHYDETAVDRWGVFKPRPAAPVAPAAAPAPYDNVRFPYSSQDTSSANPAARVWQLSTIALPTGGMIQVDYEAKDYAYVQDRCAMQMYKIVGFAGSDGLRQDNLYDDGHHSFNYLVVDLGTDVKKIPPDRYFHQGEKIYINCVLSVGKIALSTTFGKEEVSGYFDIGEYKAYGGSQPNYILIQLLPVNGADPATGPNPVAKALWQKMRKSLTYILRPPVLDPKASFMDNIMLAVGAVPSVLVGFMDFFNNFEGRMMDDGRGKTLDKEYGSFVRLYNPTGRKLGGGARVKRVLFYDNWDKMTVQSSNGAVYGQEYAYVTSVNGGKDDISSGVATYEPIGNEENPLLQSTGSFLNSAIAPELYYYKTEPFGESFFPAPSIGYSKVKVTDISDPTIKNNETGFELYDYYTCRDFPVITNRTLKLGVPMQSSGLSSLFGSQTRYTASQGFYIELNDMHGKLRSHKIFSQLDPATPISGTAYTYKTTNGLLDNQVSVIDPSNGLISDRWAGLDYDFYVATAESRNSSRSPSIHLNVDVIPLAFGIPFPIPVFLSIMAENVLQYKGITTTKVVYRSGLIDSTTSFDNGSAISSKNILYDGLSGDVVVTATQNEYNEPYYTTHLPAYWFYSGMGGADSNAGTLLKNFDVSKADAEPLLYGGDQVLLRRANDTPRQAWVFQNSNLKKSIITEKGGIVSTVSQTYDLKVIRSGRKNRLSDIATTIISKANPISADRRLSFGKVIDASATEFQEHWQGYYSLHPNIRRDLCHCDSPREDINPAVYEITFNNDGSIRHPSGARFDGSTISIQEDSCNVLINLDTTISNWPSCYKGGSGTISFTHVKPVDPPGYCTISYQAEGDYEIRTACGQVVGRGHFTMSRNCVPTRVCQKQIDSVPNPLVCEMADGVPVNPYLLGILGNWRPLTNYKYVTDRTYTSGLPNDQGEYGNFQLCLTPDHPFTFSSGISIDRTAWQVADVAALFDPHGNLLESINALKIPSTRLLGYGFNLPTAVVSDADHRDIVFDGFEDYDYLQIAKSPLADCGLQAHFAFEHFGTGDSISRTVSHTGKKSMRVAPGTVTWSERKAGKPDLYPDPDAGVYTKQQYVLKRSDLIQPFKPLPGSKYVLSLWINESRADGLVDSSIGFVRLIFSDSTGGAIGLPLIFRSKGPLIDNWQQVNDGFLVPDNARKIRIELVADTAAMFVDDIRIQPFNSQMKAYVYDPARSKLMAVLDEENYATFYEYDGEGELTRTKKETESGIVTVQEARSAKPKSARLKL